jgi:hypothetical protein
MRSNAASHLVRSSVILAVAAFAIHAAAAHLPRGAVILDRAAVAPDREMVLWMLHPERHPFVGYPDEPYTCPDQVTGSYYRGRARLSLIDSRHDELLQTLPVSGWFGSAIELPYAMRPGHAYETTGEPDAHGERKARILALRDLNGDGSASEFALFARANCSEMRTTILGYDSAHDRVVQYRFVMDDGAPHWIDSLLQQPPTEPGHWHYVTDTRGRGGAAIEYDVRFDRTRGAYLVTRRLTP